MWTIFWSSILLACVGILFLRAAGRKSISQMTVPQLVILLAIGTILGTEVSGKGLMNTVIALGTFIGVLVAIEWLTLRWNPAETIIKGKSVLVIDEGNLVVPNLRKLRMSVDDLEKRLRIAGISKFKDVKSGTIEDNGELGYDLYPHAKPVTREDLENMLKSYLLPVNKQSTSHPENIFTEVQSDSHQKKVPENLQ